jgi:hypothetical protein
MFSATMGREIVIRTPNDVGVLWEVATASRADARLIP